MGVSSGLHVHVCGYLEEGTRDCRHYEDEDLDHVHAGTCDGSSVTTHVPGMNECYAILIARPGELVPCSLRDCPIALRTDGRCSVSGPAMCDGQVAHFSSPVSWLMLSARAADCSLQRGVCTV